MQWFLVDPPLVRSASVQRDLQSAAQAVQANQAQRKSKGVNKKDNHCSAHLFVQCTFSSSGVLLRKETQPKELPVMDLICAPLRGWEWGGGGY